MSKLRAAIVGMDHWYAALGELEGVRQSERVEVVAIAHRDAAKAEATAQRFGVPHWTTDYASLVDRSDVDLVATACTTAENPALCRAAAAAGKHIISVKPLALSVADAQSIAKAVKAAGVHFASFDAYWRLSPVYQRIQQWVGEGRIGKVLSAYTLLRSPLPTQVWPGEHGETWWLDPAKVPGGGWLDHSIYHIDFLRWLLQDEVVKVSGEVANVKYPDLRGLEDYGASNLTFKGGARAICEVTWTAPKAGGLSQLHLTGEEGQIVYDPVLSGKLAVTGKFADAGGPSGWLLSNAPSGPSSFLEHLASAVQDGTPLCSGVEDAIANLRVALAFYEAARSGKSVQVG